MLEEPLPKRSGVSFQNGIPGSTRPAEVTRVRRMPPLPRHCEERSDEAIHLNGSHPKMDCRVAFGFSQ